MPLASKKKGTPVGDARAVTFAFPVCGVVGTAVQLPRDLSAFSSLRSRAPLRVAGKSFSETNYFDIMSRIIFARLSMAAAADHWSASALRAAGQQLHPRLRGFGVH